MTGTNEYKFQTVVMIPLTDEERDNQTINEEHAGAAVAAMYRDGIVVLENAVNIEHVDNLNQVLASEAETLASLPTTHFNNVCVLNPCSTESSDMTINRIPKARARPEICPRHPP